MREPEPRPSEIKRHFSSEESVPPALVGRGLHLEERTRAHDIAVQLPTR
jgi:hypothetical protein